MPLTILSDSAIQALLHSLDREDILNLQQTLADALHVYSTAVDTDENGCGSIYQPHRTVLQRGDGSTTLFMPASCDDGLGVKMVTLTSPSETAGSEDSSSVAAQSFSSMSLASSMSTSKSTSSSPGSSTTTFDVPAEVSCQWTDRNMTTGSTPRGSLTLLDKTGSPRALLNAEELTAFRTALTSTMLFKKRTNVHDVVIFGAGKQAYWHTRLALLLRGEEIHHLTIINRNFMNAKAMVRRLFHDLPVPEAVTLHRPNLAILTPGHTEYPRLQKSTLRGASAVFCTTPSTSPLFPASIFTNTEGRKKGRYICAVGSYKSHMIEIPVEMLQQAVAPPHKHHHHRHARQGGAVIVDSVEGCLREAGEVIQAGLKGEEVVELGELVMLKRDAEKRRREKEELDAHGVEIVSSKKGRKGKKSSSVDGTDQADEGLRQWLQAGNVIYKSVGLGLMDVVVGGELTSLADERGLGVRVEEF